DHCLCVSSPHCPASHSSPCTPAEKPAEESRISSTDSHEPARANQCVDVVRQVYDPVEVPPAGMDGA
ncbi:hypothetical protein LEMLEM_LOCUS16258, partial [Lemmus lemmus]